MARKSYKEELKQLSVLRCCETLIMHYLEADTITDIMKQKIGYATDLYKRAIPTTNNENLSGALKVSWDDFIEEVDKRLTSTQIKT